MGGLHQVQARVGGLLHADGTKPIREDPQGAALSEVRLRLKISPAAHGETEVRTYRVIRNEPRGSAKAHATLATGLTYQQAQDAQEQEEKALTLEPGYRPNVMSRPIIIIELEKPKDAQS